MPVMTSQILKSVNITKTYKSRYLENKTLFFSLNKKNNYTSRVTLLQKNSFVVEVACKNILSNKGQSKDPFVTPNKICDHGL